MTSRLHRLGRTLRHTSTGEMLCDEVRTSIDPNTFRHFQSVVADLEFIDEWIYSSEMEGNINCLKEHQIQHIVANVD